MILFVNQVGEKALVLKGMYAGKIVEVTCVNRDEYNCDLEIIEGKTPSGVLLRGMEYEDFSKLYHQ